MMDHLRAVLRVLEEDRVTDPDTRATALLHDVLEDTPTSYEELAQAFGKQVADKVQALSRPDGYVFAMLEATFLASSMLAETWFASKLAIVL